MPVSTTAYRRMSSQPRIVFKISRILAMGAVLGLVASFFLKVDIVARAPGVVIPANETRPVAATINGIVDRFEVSDGERVAEGDILVTLRDPSLDIELERVETNLRALALESVVITALLEDTDQASLQAQLAAVTSDEADVRNWMRYAKGQQEADRAVLKEFDASEVLLLSELDALASNSRWLDTILDLQNDKNERVQTMVERSLQSEFAGLDSVINIAEMQERVSFNSAQIVIKQAELSQLGTRRLRHVQQSQFSLIERLTAIENEMTTQRASLLDITEQKAQLFVRAPIDGTVQEISNTALNQRVGSEPLLNLVPLDNDLQVIARIKNQDIGEIAAGHPAELLFDAYPLAIYGTSQAVVDTVTEDVAGISENIPVPVNVTDIRAYAGELREISTGLTYMARLSVDEDANPRIQLRPGLSVLVNIKTGEQRVITFFVTPLLRAWHWTLKE